MRTGGVLVDGEWLVAVHNLRVGDTIQHQNWSPEGDFWWGGDVSVVESVSEPTGLRDGFHYLVVYSRITPAYSRLLAIRPGDRVTMVSRDVVEVVVDTTTSRVVRGPQLSLNLGDE